MSIATSDARVSGDTRVSGQLAGVSGWTTAAQRYAIPHLRLRQVAAIVNELKPASMLDIGCSSGFLRTLCPGIAYTGCDFIVA